MPSRPGVKSALWSNPKWSPDDKMAVLARDICKKIESDLEYPGQIKVNLIRESRATGYAK